MSSAAVCVGHSRPSNTQLLEPRAISHAVPGAAIHAASARLASIDLLRGATVAAMILVNHPGDWDHVHPSLAHAGWHGLTAADVIFPVFLFILGAAAVLSFERKCATGLEQAALAVQALKRGLTIAALGWLLAGFPFGPASLADLRIPGVLPRIGVVSIVGSLVLLARRRGLLVLAIVTLLAVHTLLLLGIGYDLSRGGNVELAVDRAVLGSHSLLDGGDPEGIVSTLSATATMLTGALAGYLMLSGRARAPKLGWMIAVGAAAVAVGSLWSGELAADRLAGMLPSSIHLPTLPLNKHLWTPSFVLATSGIAAVLLVLASLLADVVGLRQSLAPLFTLGTNPLLAYVLSELIGKTMQIVAWHHADGTIVSLRTYLFSVGFGWVSNPTIASHGFAVAILAVCYLVVRACDAHGWHLKV